MTRAPLRHRRLAAGGHPTPGGRARAPGRPQGDPAPLDRVPAARAAADGAVLVVGASHSGADLALELANAGHQVVLAGRVHGELPYTGVRGRISALLLPTVASHVLTVRTPVGARLRPGVRAGGGPLLRVTPRTWRLRACVTTRRAWSTCTTGDRSSMTARSWGRARSCGRRGSGTTSAGSSRRPSVRTATRSPTAGSCPPPRPVLRRPAVPVRLSSAMVHGGGPRRRARRAPRRRTRRGPRVTTRRRAASSQTAQRGRGLVGCGPCGGTQRDHVWLGREHAARRRREHLTCGRSRRPVRAHAVRRPVRPPQAPGAGR